MGIYKREDITSLINKPEAGGLKHGIAGGVNMSGKFVLEKWDDAFTTAEKGVGLAGAGFVLYRWNLEWF